MSGPMGHFGYISDNGQTYNIRGDVSNAALTGGVANTTGLAFPKRFRVRYLLAQSPTTGRERKVPVYDPTNALWTAVTPGTINLYDEAVRSLSTVPHQIRARVGEKRYN